jgi:biotin carboxyl carrier protein
MHYEFNFKGETYPVTVEKREKAFRVKVGDRVHEVNASALSEGLLSMIIDDRSVLAYTARHEKGCIICIGGVPYELADPAAQDSAHGASADHRKGDGLITTPMPGKIVAVHVKEGDRVEKNQPLLVVESMKMQNEILSDVDGVVKKIHFNPGDQAAFGDPLVEIEV